MTALAEYNKDPYDLHYNTITFAEVFEKWSEVHFPKVSDSNVKGYKASFRTCEKLHNMKFVEIKLDHLQQAVDESGKNTPTLKKMKIMFGLMYDYAVMHEIVTADKGTWSDMLILLRQETQMHTTGNHSTRSKLIWFGRSKILIHIILSS